MRPGQAELMGVLHELHAVRNREELHAFASEYQRDVPLNDMPVRPGPDPRRSAMRNADMTDFETTSFPRMGDEPLTDHLVDVSGARSRYMRYLPRDAKGVGVGGTTVTPDVTDDNAPGTGDKGNRKQVLQPRGYSAGAAHRIATVIAGGQADAPQRGYTVRGPYQRNAAAAAASRGPVVVEDDGWR